MRVVVKGLKKVFAMVLVSVMVAGLVQGIGPVKEVKAADTPESLGYTKIGINDFGLEEERTWPGILEKETGTYSGDLSGKYLDVDVQFSGEQSVNTSFDYAAGTNGWGGIRVGVFNEGLYIYPATMEGSQNTVNCIYFAPKTIGIRDFTQKFNLKLAVKYDSITSGTANNVTIHAWANGVCLGYEYDSITLFGQTIGVHATAGTITMKTPSEATTDYATISIGDFGLSEVRTWPMTPAEEYGTYLYGDLKETCFNANVKFKGTQDSSNAFDYASSDAGWGGLRVAVIEEELYIYPATDGESPLTSDYIKYTVDDANLGTFKQTFNLKLALTYDSIASKVGKNVKVTVWVNGAKKTHTFASVRMFGTMLGVHATDGKIIMSNPSNPANTNVLVTPEDLGIAYGTYNAAGTSIVRQDTKDTMDQITLSAKMKFEGTGAYVTLCSEDSLGWAGLRFGTSEVNSKFLYLYDTKLGLNVDNGKGFAFDPSIADATLVGKEVEVQLSLNYLDKHRDGKKDDLQVGVWFNGNLYNNTYCVFPNILTNGDAKGNYFAIALGESSAVSLESARGEVNLPTTLWDYAVENGSVTNGANVTAIANDIATLDKTTFTAEVKFPAGSGSGFRIGGWDSNYSWYGINLYLSDDGKNVYLQDLYAGTTGATGQDACVYTSNTSLAGSWTKVELAFRVLGNDLFVTFNFNDNFETTKCFPSAGPYAGGYLVLCSAAGTTLSYRSVGERKYVYKDAVSYDLRGRTGYLISGFNVTVNGAAASNGDVLSTSGDYIIERTVKGKTYRQLVSLYRIGDVYTDNIAGSWADGVHLEDYINGTRILTKAAMKAADFNNDGVVDKTDLQHMRYIRASEAEAATRLAATINMYYPPALTYDFLGGNDVMPIYGFFGPTNTPSINANNLLTDQVYSYLQEAGINVITYTPDNMADATSQFPKMLELGEKYGIGYYVADGRLNTAIDTSKNVLNGAPLTAKQTADIIDDYSFYSSYLGTDLGDEPSANDFTAANKLNGQQASVFPEGRLWKYHQDASKNLNQYVNNCGMMNHAPSDAPWLIDYYYTSGHELTAFQNYWDNVYKTGDVQALAFDHYPFQDFNTEDVTNAGSFFKSLMITRQKSLQHNVPMWVLMAAGGCFEATDKGTIATTAEHLWNANTLLAFGAKGIGYFTLVQYKEFCKNANGVVDESLNSVITYSGGKSPYFNVVKQINTQIQAVDEVLMKSRSKGVIATAGYAWSETYTDVESTYNTGTIISTAGTQHLTGVSASNTTYGAFVGCFDYKETEAYYVVNYNVTGSQTVSLSFDKAYNVRYIQDGVTKTVQGSSLSLALPAGGGALVVLDSALASNSSSLTQYDGSQYEITHRDFKDSTGAALTDKTYEYSGTAANVTKITTYNPYAVYSAQPSNVNGTTFSTNITFHGDADIRYGGNGADGWYGITMMPVLNGSQLEVLFEGNPNNRPRFYITAESVGLTSFLDTPMDLKMNVAIMNADSEAAANDIRLGLYINGIMATGNYIVMNNCGDYLGK